MSNSIKIVQRALDTSEINSTLNHEIKNSCFVEDNGLGIRTLKNWKGIKFLGIIEKSTCNTER